MTIVEVATTIDAPVERVWQLLADLPRMSEWSPETQKVVWKDDATEAVEGARFGGRNRHGLRVWTTSNEVITAVPGREIAWRTTSGPFKVAVWRYTLRADGGSTKVTETWLDERGRLVTLSGAVATGVRDRKAHNEQTMTQTLAKLKQAAEIG